MKKVFAVSSAGLFALAYIAYIVCAIASGGDFLSLCLYSLAFVFCVLFAGKALQEILLPDIKGFSCLPLSFAFGAILVYVSFILTSLINQKSLCLLIPFIVGSYRLYKNKNNFDVKGFSKILPHHSILFLISAIFIFIYIICVLLPYAQANKLGYFYYHQDMLWSVGNAASVYNGFPLVDMRFSASTLNYHYLNDALAGILGLGVGGDAYTSLCFYYYPLVALCLIFSLYAVACRICKNKILCTVLPFVVLFVYGFNSESTYHYISNINGQGAATLVLCGGLILISYLGKIKFCNIRLVIAAFILGFCISMFKSTIGALFILAVIAACVVGFFIKKTTLPHILSATGLGAGFIIAYTFIFSGAINNLVFDGFHALPQFFITVFSYSPIGLILYAACLVYSLFNFKKLSFLQLVSHAMFIGGVVAFLIYYHYSASQIYFLLIAIPMLWIANLEFIENYIFKNKNFAVIFVAIILLCSIPSFISILPHARTGIQAAKRIAGGQQFEYDESYIGADDYNAMMWLKQNTPQSAIFATNRNNKSLAAAEGTFHYYSAVSQRRCYIESYRYCMDYSGMYKEVRRRLEDVSDNIFRNYSQEQAFETAKKEKVDYLVVFSPLKQTDWSVLPVYQNDTVKIYEVI